jgi:hypothetical protein
MFRALPCPRLDVTLISTLTDGESEVWEGKGHLPKVTHPAKQQSQAVGHRGKKKGIK